MKLEKKERGKLKKKDQDIELKKQADSEYE